MTSPSSTEADRRRRPAPFVSRDGDRSVVWLVGEQDIATVSVLAEMLTNMASLDDADLVVDLSEVSFIDAATLSVLIRGRNVLQGRSRNLTLRAPSRCAQRVLEMCGVADLIDPPALARQDASPNLRSGVGS
jgi:anti-sigma B factor antagonist